MTESQSRGFSRLWHYLKGTSSGVRLFAFLGNIPASHPRLAAFARNSGLSRILSWCALNKWEVMAGVTVPLAQIPEVVAFSFVAGVDPLNALNATWIIGLITALLGGRPAMVSGAAGSTAVVMGPFVVANCPLGLGHLFYAIILAGFLQILVGLLRLGKFLAMVSESVMIGFVNGLAILILMSQVGPLKVGNPSPSSPDCSKGEAKSFWASTAFGVFVNGIPFLPMMDLLLMFSLGAITFALMLIMPRITRIPAALIAIGAATIVEWGVIRPLIQSSTKTVKDLASAAGGEIGGTLPIPLWWTDTKLPALDFQLFTTILPFSGIIALIGLVESLMTLQLMDEITGTKGNPNRECIAQGFGNVTCGTFATMGGASMIGQSMINVNSGGRTRLSSTVAALFILFTVVALAPVIEIIPAAALLGVMLYVVFKTFEWRSLRYVSASILPARVRRALRLFEGHKIRRGDAFIIVVVTVVTVLWNLAYAVLIGVVLQSLFFAWFARSALTCVDGETPVQQDDPFYLEMCQLQKLGQPVQSIIKTYDIRGPLYFVPASIFVNFFTPASDPYFNEVQLPNSKIYDHTAVEALKKVADKYRQAGKRFRLRYLNEDCQSILLKSMNIKMNLEVEEDRFDQPAPPRYLNVYQFEKWQHEPRDSASHDTRWV